MTGVSIIVTEDSKENPGIGHVRLESAVTLGWNTQQGAPGKQCGLAATGDYQPSLRSPWLAAVVAPGFDVTCQFRYLHDGLSASCQSIRIAAAHNCVDKHRWR
ncbi:hypothetical protein [Thiolapillus sp.]|uniref:hypothetical protein n=1 Tax=Thiolapillus sp. TaxID=2017437 RepID=UPI003AF7CB1D